MKRFVVFLLFICLMGKSQSQDFSYHTFKAGVGYTHEFAGMNGYTLSGEYIFPLAGQFEGGMGLQYASLQGYPRTSQVLEFTRAQTIDFSVYWVPVHTDAGLFRVGIGYSFSFYSIKRSDPVWVVNGNEKTMSWPASFDHGRTAGFNAIAEYEYSIPGSSFSIGVRGALYKTYDQTFLIGPTAAFRF